MATRPGAMGRAASAAMADAAASARLQLLECERPQRRAGHCAGGRRRTVAPPAGSRSTPTTAAVCRKVSTCGCCRGVQVEVSSRTARLGLADEVLAVLEVVVASIHSAQRQDRATITDAVSEPFATHRSTSLATRPGGCWGTPGDSDRHGAGVAGVPGDRHGGGVERHHPGSTSTTSMRGVRWNWVQVGGRLRRPCCGWDAGRPNIGIGVARRAGLSSGQCGQHEAAVGMLALLKDGQLQKG
jgi:hypothetical protein